MGQVRSGKTEAEAVSDASPRDSESTLALDIDHEPELTDEDILDAMRRIPGYIDISTDDFRVIYHLAWRHAVARLRPFRDGNR